jgi:hypothetical protein
MSASATKLFKFVHQFCSKPMKTGFWGILFIGTSLEMFLKTQ